MLVFASILLEPRRRTQNVPPTRLERFADPVALPPASRLSTLYPLCLVLQLVDSNPQHIPRSARYETSMRYARAKLMKNSHR